MERAARLFAWANCMRSKHGGHRPANEQADVEQDLTTLRAHLAETALQAAASAGQAMTIAEAIALAIQEKG